MCVRVQSKRIFSEFLKIGVISHCTCQLKISSEKSRLKNFLAKETTVLFTCARKVLENFKELSSTMGMPKKENIDAKDTFAIAKRPSMHSKKDCRQSLQRNISRMFSNDNDIDRNR